MTHQWDPTASRSLSERLAAVTGEVAEAARVAGRDAAQITTIVVTKWHSADLVRELSALGVHDFAESRHQEAQPKIAMLGDLAATWHFVGQLQSNKARHVRRYVDVIHSIDRTSLVAALTDGDGASFTVTECFIQLNLTEDPRRGGVHYEDLARLAEQVLASRALKLLGVMAVAPQGTDPRAAFARVRQASELVQTIEPTASFISAGMSNDFREAVLEGATHLRIGTAITGKRAVRG